MAKNTEVVVVSYTQTKVCSDMRSTFCIKISDKRPEFNQLVLKIISRVWKSVKACTRHRGEQNNKVSTQTFCQTWRKVE